MREKDDAAVRTFPGAELIRRPRVRRWLLVALIAVAAYGLLGVFAVPPLLRSILAGKLTRALDRRTTIESVSVNPFALSLRIRGLTIRERASEVTFVSLGELYADFKLSSILHLAPVVKELRVENPSVHLVRLVGSTYNFSDLIAPVPGSERPSRPLRYALNNIQLSGGHIEFDDRPRGRVQRVDQLFLAIPFLSNLPDETQVFVRPALHAVINGTRLRLDGRTKPFASSRQTALDFEFSDLDVPPYLTYLPYRLPVEVRSALVSSRLTLTFRQGEGGPPTLALSGTMALRNVRLTDREGADLLAFPLLEVGIAEADLLSGRTRLESVLLQHPTLRVARDAAGRSNLPARAPASAGSSEASPAGGRGLALSVASLEVVDGTVQLTDEAVSPPFLATLHPVGLAVQGFATAPGPAASIKLSVTSDAGETLSVTGGLTYAPAAVHATLEAAGVPLRRYAPYFRNAIAFQIADGVLGLSTGFSWSGGDTLTLAGLTATLRSLRLHRPGAKGDFLAIPETTLTDCSADVHGRDVTFGTLSITRAHLEAARDPAGIWNLAGLLTGRAEPPAPATSSPGWSISMHELSVQHASVEVDDALPGRAVHIALERLEVTARGLSTAPGSRGRVEARAAVNGSGRVAVSGDLGLAPFTATLKAEVHEVPLVPLQGYLADHLHLVVNDGTASAAGTITVAAGGSHPGTAFEGRASVDSFATVDAYAARDLVRWTSLALDGVSFASAPFHLAIASVAISGLTTRVAVDADGGLNLRRVLGLSPAVPAAGDETDEVARTALARDGDDGAATSPEATPIPEAATAPGPGLPEPAPEGAVRIEKVTLAGGTLRFVDHSVSPPVRIEVGDLGGAVSGLSSLASTAAEVDIHAILDGDAPLSVTGQVNPLARQFFLDVKVVGRDFDMPALSPYSGEYAGYAIERGKLDVSLTYKVDHRHLQADNTLRLDQFDFGQRVESPKATHLPVRLAVSLLKNREGQIDLQLPVSGSLDDPTFRVGRIILKMVLNLLAKVATSPFALLGSLLGGGHAQLDTVAFAPGAATLDATAHHSLDILATALYDRPALRLDITGLSDPVSDTNGLRQLALDLAIKREKLDEIISKGGTAPSLEAVVVAPSEYDTYLALAYKHRKFKKPRNFLGIAKKEPADVMERLLLESFTPSRDAVRALATARAEAVQTYLLQTGKVKADRLFIVAGSTTAPPSVGGGNGPATRVDLVLK